MSRESRGYPVEAATHRRVAAQDEDLGPLFAATDEHTPVRPTQDTTVLDAVLDVLWDHPNITDVEIAVGVMMRHRELTEHRISWARRELALQRRIAPSGTRDGVVTWRLSQQEDANLTRECR